jgi:DNA-binding response OmpR family regulator
MAKKRILLCDDDDGILEVTQIVLEEQGYEVIAWSQCDDIEAIAAQHPDLILLDLWIPELGGEEIARRLKADSRTKAIPIIIVSANKDTEKVAKQSGAEDFICKPFDIDYLETKVASYLS